MNIALDNLDSYRFWEGVDNQDALPDEFSDEGWDAGDSVYRLSELVGKDRSGNSGDRGENK